MRDYKKYDIWKLAHLLALEIYKVTESFPKSEIFGLTSQARRAVTAINLNFVEGCGRGSDEDFKRVLRIASGEAFEIEYILLLAKDLNYITEEQFQYLSPKATELKMKISKLILKIEEDIKQKNINLKETATNPITNKNELQSLKAESRQPKAFTQNSMINIVLFGPPGSGKGTQAQHLIERFNLKQISTGDLFRYNIKNETELGKLAKSYMDKGELVPDQVTIDMLTEEVKKPTETKGFIFDGFPRTAFQTQALETIVKEILDDEISVCLSLVVEDEILVERLLKRGETSGRTDDSNEEIIRNRITEYYAKTAEVAELYKQQGKYVEINGVGEIDEISRKLFQEVEKIKK